MTHIPKSALPLALVTLFLCPLMQVESASSSANCSSSEVPEWFENCILHWVYTQDLVDRKPFCRFPRERFLTDKTRSGDEVSRCWDEETRAMAYPNTFVYHPYCPPDTRVFPPEASPLLLRALKKLIDKGRVTPFSSFEVHSRVSGTSAPWLLQNYWEVPMRLEPVVVRSQDGLQLQCRDYNCDQNSLEYWYHLFHVYKTRLNRRPEEIIRPNYAMPIRKMMTFYHPVVKYKYGIPIPYRPPFPPPILQDQQGQI